MGVLGSLETYRTVSRATHVSGCCGHSAGAGGSSPRDAPGVSEGRAGQPGGREMGVSSLRSGATEPAAVAGQGGVGVGGSTGAPWKNSPAGHLPAPTAGTKMTGTFNTEQRLPHGGVPSW